MTGLDLWPLIGAFVAGVALGTVIAGGVVLEREFFWTVCVRLPDALHRKLRRGAETNGWSLRTEVLRRLEQSVGGGVS
jgi:hypothetical protein